MQERMRALLKDQAAAAGKRKTRHGPRINDPEEIRA